MGRVDVIVPCYNYGRFLEECVESILNQPVNLRVLIIDDASTDETPEVASRLSSDPRVEVRRHPANRGHIATYNEGLEWASADYTLLISADDMLTPDALLRASEFLDARPEAGFVYGRVIRMRSSEDRPLARQLSGNDGWAVVAGEEWLRSICQEGDNLITSPEVVVRTDLQRKLGGYRQDLPHTADMELWMRLAAHAAVGILEADQAYYRIHGRNMSEQYNERITPDFRRIKPEDYFQRKAAYDALFQFQGNHLANPEDLQRLASEGLAWNAFWMAHASFEWGEISVCDKLLDTARGFLPEIADDPAWAHLQWKRQIGPRAWHVAKFLVRPIRRLLTHPSVPEKSSPGSSGLDSIIGASSGRR